MNQIKGKARRRILRNAGIIPVKDTPIYCFNCADHPACHLEKSGDGALLCAECYLKARRRTNILAVARYRQKHGYKDRTAAKRMREYRRRKKALPI